MNLHLRFGARLCVAFVCARVQFREFSLSLGSESRAARTRGQLQIVIWREFTILALDLGFRPRDRGENEREKKSNSLIELDSNPNILLSSAGSSLLGIAGSLDRIGAPAESVLSDYFGEIIK